MREEYRGLPYHASNALRKPCAAASFQSHESDTNGEDDIMEEVSKESYPDGSAVHECRAVPKVKKGSIPR